MEWGEGVGHLRQKRRLKGESVEGREEGSGSLLFFFLFFHPLPSYFLFDAIVLLFFFFFFFYFIFAFSFFSFCSGGELYSTIVQS